MNRLGEHIKPYFNAILNSYSQIFFSDNKLFSLLLILASFLDPYCGISGLLAIITVIHAAKIFSLNAESIHSGLYSFNALLVGLMMGYYYSFSPIFFLVLFFVSLLTLFLTVWFETQLSKSGLPFLSLPFIAVVWIILLGSRNFGAIILNERGIYTLNELWSLGGPALIEFYQTVDSLNIPSALAVYMKSLGAIFFQPNVIAGFLIALGLLLFSRIAFTLSLIGFFTGYIFYYYIEGNFSDLLYSYIGFNFILSAIAIGGFFTIPSAFSYLLVIAVTPLTVIFSSALGSALSVFQLPVFSLSFNIIVILTLAVLRWRTKADKIEMVQAQQFSPEKNLYKHKNRIERFKNDTLFHIHLPFYGEWQVSQAHHGKLTHKGEWAHAWDFVVNDETGKTFRPPGEELSDFYCYGLPVLAPAAGYVFTVIDEVDDNPIGSVDIVNNWGNTIVIKHSDYLYSKISHIKKNSFRVKQGDYVKKGDLIAACGNSGRSPEPHIHFQLQSTPAVGSKTLNYPISYYIRRASRGGKGSEKNGSEKISDQARWQFHSFDYPEQNQIISKPSITPLIREAMNFVPGAVIKFIVNKEPGAEEVKWEILVDMYNQPYIFCHNSGSYAYFVNNETLHYFTAFSGNKNSLLYHFYIGAHKILLGYYHQLEIKDKLPIEGFHSGLSQTIQDFIAPFHIYLKADYAAVFESIDEISNPSAIEISSRATVKTGSMVNREIQFRIVFRENKIYSFSVKEKGKTTIAERSE